MIEYIKQVWEQYQGDIMMVLGALVMAYIPFKERVNGVVGKVWAPIRTQKPSTESTLDGYSTHDIVGILIDERQEYDDEEGVELIVAFGKHLYDFDKNYVEETITDDKV